MRLSPTLLTLIASTVLSGCGGASQPTETTATTTRTASVSTEAPATSSPTTTLPPTNGAAPEEIYAVECGRG